MGAIRIEKRSTRRKLTIYNLAFSLLNQLIAMASGLIVPRLILQTFGSNTNGLVSSITQMLNYISLVEGGLGSVITAALYKAIATNDQTKVSSIVITAKKFFKQIGIIYFIYTIILSFVYPLTVKASLSYKDICLLVYIIAISGLIKYLFSVSYRLLIIAENRGFIVSIVHSIITVLDLVCIVVTIKIYPSIHLVKLIQAVFFCVQPLVFRYYVNQYFPIDAKALPDKDALSQRWSGFGQNIAFFIHSNTDVVVLTYFSSLENVSVYSVYLLFIRLVNTTISSLSTAFIPNIGHAIASKDPQRTRTVFGIYEFGTWFITEILFCSCVVLITPFVGLYVGNVSDTNYYQPLFGTIMTLAEMIYVIRNVYINVIYSSGHFRQTAIHAYLEAFMNIVLSVALVNSYGLIGVGIGTLLSMTTRLILSVVYLTRHILHRPFSFFAKKVVLFSAAGLIGIVISRIITIEYKNIYCWIVNGFITVSILFICTFFFSFLFDRPSLKQSMEALFKKKCKRL